MNVVGEMFLVVEVVVFEIEVDDLGEVVDEEYYLEVVF